MCEEGRREEEAQERSKVTMNISLMNISWGDPNGLFLTYQWTFVSWPTDSTATITDANQSTATFVSDQLGAYVIQLTVSDGTATNSTTVTVNVS